MLILILPGANIRELKSEQDIWPREDNMTADVTRRALVSAGAALALGSAWPANGQARKKLRFSSAFTEQDLRAEAYKAFGAAIKDDFEFEPFWGNTMFSRAPNLWPYSAAISKCAT